MLKLLLGRAGMGDVLTLVEKAEEAAKQNDTEYMMKRLMQNKFDFNDFLNQYKMMNSMGTMGQVMKMIPGIPFAANNSSTFTGKDLIGQEEAVVHQQAVLLMLMHRDIAGCTVSIGYAKTSCCSHYVASVQACWDVHAWEQLASSS